MNSQRVTLIMALVVGMSVAAASPALAHEKHHHDHGDHYPSGSHAMFYKLGRGVSNGLTGWMEFPYQIGQTYESHNPVGSFIVGVLKGATVAVGRTAVGAVEILTFWLPVPPDYAAIMPHPGYFPHD